MGRPLSTHDIESGRTNKPPTWRDWAAVFTGSALGYLCLMLTVITYFNPALLPFNPVSLVFNKQISPFFAFSHGSEDFSKPDGFKIVALVPFNDYERTSILDCYLQKNLATNRGFLDEVVFVPQTEDKTSLDWLDSAVQKTPEYTSWPSMNGMEWEVAEDNILYIRIDGDVVFMEDHTIPTIVKTKLDNPKSLMVSANVANEAALAFLHSHPGVALPYLPEVYHVARSSLAPSHDWRPSSLPYWRGPDDFKIEKGFQPPFHGHRWLLPADTDSDRDPIAASIYDENGPGLQDWTVSAQQHYSFLHHLEAGYLHRYKFPIWASPTEPISQNFGCFWGKDARTLGGIFGNHSSPESLAKSWMGVDGTRPHVLIDGKGLVSRYAGHLGPDGLDSTDLLDRYRAYTREKVC
ncbi:hypothetical protein N7492_003952 [Penicillium capsulatum]|uniref:Uncharacterized protein n=1 Tax=Penicillium capsulatum TaxID=69766 RepID=A0A9W9LXX9_9EURO|nr:hypothetical protein N7492_003952 [Penicillium capsulatum]KAJ6121470.1 hypothetical protein N7512_003935 [Penicillium capsulatum]